MTLYPVSSWYGSLATFTFPTVFVSLTGDERTALADGASAGKHVDAVILRLNRVIRQLPGNCFVHADVCAPTDSALFQAGSAVRTGRRAWDILTGSEKVRNAFRTGQTQRLGVHPYRRLDPVREFRLFVCGGRLVAMSQMRLDRHYRRLAGRREQLWREAVRLHAEIAGFLPASELAIDVYLTSANELLIIDLNPWGPPTDPLLLRSWDQDWSAEIGLKLIPPPTQLKGDVEVSF